MTDKLDDKQIELNRYDSRASRELDNFDSHHASKLGAELFADYLRTPYLHFESLLKTQLSSEHKVLEIGAGTGQHTDVLAKSERTLLPQIFQKIHSNYYKRELSNNSVCRSQHR